MFYVCSVVVAFFFSSRRRHTRCALVTGVQTCALPIFPRKLVRADGDPAHCHRASTESRRRAIDPANLLAARLAGARCRPRTGVGRGCASLLVQPSVRCGGAVPQHPATILGLVSREGGLPLGLIGSASWRERGC